MSIWGGADLKSLHSFIFLGAMGQSNWFWPRILAQFAEESEHSGGFTNPELPHQARVDTIFLYK